MFVRNNRGRVVRGYSLPLFVDDQIYDGQSYMGQLKSTIGKLIVHGDKLIAIEIC